MTEIIKEKLINLLWDFEPIAESNKVSLTDIESLVNEIMLIIAKSNKQ